ncbi:MAG: phosphoribosylglycinamide synthetase [Kocuria rhizophila]|nr:MAG: phosphoribosylglycinamide synthetase [Kocuria rhizophila]
MTRKPATIAIVDGYSAGQNLLRATRRHGARAIHIRSTCRWSETMAVPDLSLYDAAFDIIDGNPTDSDRYLLERLNVVGVLPGQESAVESTDRLATALGLAANDYQLTSARRNKYEMNERVRATGLPAVAQRAGSSPEELARWVDRHTGYPAVVKPLDSAGTDGVVICYDRTALLTAAFEVLKGKNLFGKPNRQALAQEYLRGDEYIVDTVSRDGRHFICGIWKYSKRLQASGKNLYDLDVLLDPSSPECRDMGKYAGLVLDALGIVEGPAHTEIIMTVDGPRLVEVGARLNGNMMDSFHDVCLGHNQADLTVRSVLDPDGFDEQTRDGIYRRHMPAAVFHGASEQEGTVDAVDSECLERIHALKSLHGVVVKYGPGDFLPRTVDLMTTSLKAYLCHPSSSQLEADLSGLRDLTLNLYRL